MCVSGVRSRVVSCECVCVSCEWASRRSSAVRREAFFFALCFVWDSEVFVSNFEFEFLVSLLYSISRISIFVSNLNLSSNSISRISIWICRRNFRRSIRLLEFRVFVLCFEVEFRIRLFRFVALFDFSKSIVKFDFSKFDFSSQVPWISNSSWSIRLLEFRFEFVVEISIRNCRRNCRLRAAFFIWVLNWTLQFSSKFWFVSPTFVLNCHLTSLIILARSPSLRSRCHASFARAFRA